MEKLENYLKKIEEENWRNLVNSLVYVRCPGELENLKKVGFEVDGRNDGFLAICYVNHEEGISFSVVAAAHLREDRIFASRENKSSVMTYRIEGLKEYEYLNQNYISAASVQYAWYIEDIVAKYEKNCEEAVEIRSLEELDGFRKPFYPDEIEVVLIGKAFGQEKVWVRVEKFGENALKGVLISEPSSACGVCKGDMIDFMLVEQNGRRMTIHVCA